MKQIIHNLFALFVGTLVSLLVAEGAVRLGESFSSPARWSDRPRYYFRHEASTTMQDFPYENPKPAKTLRIGVIGDSFSFAPYMQFTDAFPKILERMLNLNVGDLRGEVINYGVPAYSTSHEVAIVEKAISEEADLILLQITLNDPEIKPYRPTGITVFNKFGALELNGRLKSLLSYWHTANFVVTRIHNENTRRNYVDYFNDLFTPRSAAWTQFRSSMRTLVRKARRSKKPIYAVVFPLFGMPMDDSYPFFECHERVAKLMHQLEVPMLDLFSTYKGIPVERLQVMPGIDRHPNEIAHRMAAEAIYDWLSYTEKAIPESLIIRSRYSDRTRIVDEPEYVEILGSPSS